MATPGRGTEWAVLGGGSLTMPEQLDAPSQSRGTGVLEVMLKSKAVQNTSTTMESHLL